jgi:poly(hydroxyalkanoate) depolymerase family esterase
VQRSVQSAVRSGLRLGEQAMKQSLAQASAAREPPVREGDWLAGLAVGWSGMRRYRLYKPPGLSLFERVPLLVMLHGCRQDARSFALSTRIALLAARERFLVLFVEQDRHANAQGCWNWYDTRSGRAHAEASLVMAAIDQVLLLYPADASRVAIAGMSAGASMAALVASRHPQRFCAVVMHSGVPPGAAQSGASAWGAMQGRHRTGELAPAANGAWPPLLVIHGLHDRMVAPGNARAAAEAWADAVGAHAGTPRRVQRGQRYAATLTEYKLGGDTVVMLCEVHGLGHAWSGGAARQPYSDVRGPDASRLLWRFVSRQFSPEVKAVPESAAQARSR